MSEKRGQREILLDSLLETIQAMARKRVIMSRFVIKQSIAMLFLFVMGVVLFFFCEMFSSTILKGYVSLLFMIVFLLQAQAHLLIVRAVTPYRELYGRGQEQLSELIKYMDWTGMRKRQIYKGADKEVTQTIKQFIVIESQARLSPVRKGIKYITWIIHGYGFLRLCFLLVTCYCVLKLS